MDVSEEQAALRAFAAERHWETLHSPKNLVMALAGEVGELVAEFQWLAPNEATHVMTTQQGEAIRSELADVTIYLLRLADVLGVDLGSAVCSKMEKNETRFPPKETNQGDE